MSSGIVNGQGERVPVIWLNDTEIVRSTVDRANRDEIMASTMATGCFIKGAVTVGRTMTTI